MVFADSFYWFAVTNPADSAHARTLEFTSGFAGKLITTEWVLTEVCDGFAAPRYRHLALSLREAWRNDEALIIIPSDHDWFDCGLDLYCARPDKAWSLTDCISFEVMREHGVSEALTGDRHIEQAGFTPLLAGA
jgi:predicted nucleic acid-binding protein